MKVVLDIREDAFLRPKTLSQVAEEVRQAAANFWVARGDIAPEAMNDIVSIVVLATPEPNGTLMDVLMQGPNVGEDADFERPVDYGRPVVEFG